MTTFYKELLTFLTLAAVYTIYAHSEGQRDLKIHIHSFNRISSPSSEELLHSQIYLPTQTIRYNKEKVRTKKKKNSAYLKITTVIQYIITLLTFSLHKHIYILGICLKTFGEIMTSKRQAKK